MDIVILSNGPGEVTTWVRPVVRALRKRLGKHYPKVRISVVLSPCPHSTGKEPEIVASYPEVDRVLPAEKFWPFLLWGKTPEDWDWHSQGIVLFLGGDQFFTVVIGNRLGYKKVVYGEWDARWYSLVDHFVVTREGIVDKAPKKYRSKLTVVGDLMAEAGAAGLGIIPDKDLVAFLPGSKSAKLMQGMPLMLAVAEGIKQLRPNTRFILPLAPTLDSNTLATYADGQYNPLVPLMGNVSGRLHKQEEKSYITSSQGVDIELFTEFPAYECLARCSLAVTTVGANTAELGSLGVPMIVLLPTQQLDAMRAWDGIPGILANLPLLGKYLAVGINWWVINRQQLFAWPNIWAGKEIVPELVGKLIPKEIAEKIVGLLECPQELEGIRFSLKQLRGAPGAADKIAEIVISFFPDYYSIP